MMNRSMYAGQPFTNSAIIAGLLLITIGYHAFFSNIITLTVIVGFVFLIGVVSVWIITGKNRSADESTILRTSVSKAESSLKKMARIESIGKDEVESAVCSFNTFLTMEGANAIIGLMGIVGGNDEIVSRLMLERAESLFPAAYKKLDQRGRPNQSTRIARLFFTNVVREVMQHQAEIELLAKQNTTPKTVMAGNVAYGS